MCSDNYNLPCRSCRFSFSSFVFVVVVLSVRVEIVHATVVQINLGRACMHVQLGHACVPQKCEGHTKHAKCFFFFREVSNYKMLAFGKRSDISIFA